MREETLPNEIIKALVDFKASVMATELKKATKDGLERFKAKQLLTFLQE